LLIRLITREARLNLTRAKSRASLPSIGSKVSSPMATITTTTALYQPRSKESKAKVGLGGVFSGTLKESQEPAKREGLRPTHLDIKNGGVLDKNDRSCFVELL